MLCLLFIVFIFAGVPPCAAARSRRPREFHEPGLWYFSAQFFRGFVVFANLCNTFWQFYMGANGSLRKSPHNVHTTNVQRNAEVPARETPRAGPGERGEVRGGEGGQVRLQPRARGLEELLYVGVCVYIYIIMYIYIYIYVQ